MSERTVLAGAAVLTFMTTAAAVAATAGSWWVVAFLGAGTGLFLVLFGLSLYKDWQGGREIKRRKAHLVEFPDTWHADYQTEQKQLNLNIAVSMLWGGPSYHHSMTARLGASELVMKLRSHPSRFYGSATHFEYFAEGVESPSADSLNVWMRVGDILDVDIVNEVTRDVALRRW